MMRLVADVPLVVVAAGAIVAVEARVADHVDLAGMARVAARVFNVPLIEFQLCAPATPSRLFLRLPAVAGSASCGSPARMRAR